MMQTLLKLGLSGYDVNPRFGALQCEYLPQNALFSLREKIGGTRYHSGIRGIYITNTSTTMVFANEKTPFYYDYSTTITFTIPIVKVPQQ